MDRGAWRAAVHGAAKSRTRLGDLARTVSTHAVLQWYLGGRQKGGERKCVSSFVRDGCQQWQSIQLLLFTVSKPSSLGYCSVSLLMPVTVWGM